MVINQKREGDKMKVVFHINEKTKAKVLLSNVQNFYKCTKEDKEDKDIEILINGEAIDLALKDSLIDFSQLLSLNVEIMACKNSLESRNYLPNQLQNGILLVNSGVVELARKQTHGYAYIKP